MTTSILQYLTEQSIISPVESEKSKFFKAFDPADFPNDCDDLEIFKAFSEVFEIKETVLVAFQDSLPVRVLMPGLWADNNGVTFYLGNVKFPISVDENTGKYGMFLFAGNEKKIFLDWDTEVKNGKLNLFFSFLYKGKEVPLFPVFNLVEDTDTKAKEELSKSLESIKKSLKNGDYSDALKDFSRLLKPVPSFDNEATITHLFLPLFKGDGWKDIKKSHPSPIPLILVNPKPTSDQFGKVIKFQFDGNELAKRLGLPDDYLVYSWGKFKPLKDISVVTFNHSMIKNHTILQKIHSGIINVKYIVCYVISPNGSRIDWPPVLSFLSDNSVESKPEILKSLSGILDTTNLNLSANNEAPKALKPADSTLNEEIIKPKFKVAENFSFE